MHRDEAEVALAIERLRCNYEFGLTNTPLSEEQFDLPALRIDLS